MSKDYPSRVCPITTPGGPLAPHACVVLPSRAGTGRRETYRVDSKLLSAVTAGEQLLFETGSFAADVGGAADANHDSRLWQLKITARVALAGGEVGRDGFGILNISAAARMSMASLLDELARPKPTTSLSLIEMQTTPPATMATQTRATLNDTRSSNATIWNTTTARFTNASWNTTLPLNKTLNSTEQISTPSAVATTSVLNLSITPSIPPFILPPVAGASTITLVQSNFPFPV